MAYYYYAFSQIWRSYANRPIIQLNARANSLKVEQGFRSFITGEGNKCVYYALGQDGETDRERKKE